MSTLDNATALYNLVMYIIPIIYLFIYIISVGDIILTELANCILIYFV